VAALLAGGLAGKLRLPQVTAYLPVGVALGPALLDCIQAKHLPFFEPLTKLAISLVLFNLGCHFPLAQARRIFRRVMRLSLGELGLTFLLVAAGLAVLGEPWQAALLLAALALATAPATTILVLKETESEGPVTEYTNALVALNNLASIVLFEVLFLAVYFAGGHLDVLVVVELGRLVRDLAGSIVLGVGGGLIVSYSYPLVSASRRLVLLVAVIVLLLAVCELPQPPLPYLLTFLAMGVTVANSSDQTRQVLAELDRLTGLLCVVFFVTHGAELQPEKLGVVPVIAVGYILFRFAGKYVGIRLAAGTGGDEPTVRRWLGATLVAQAGAAIALSSMAVDRTEGLGGALHDVCLRVETVILGTVVVFELIGPILIRQAVIRSGEVPLAQAIHHATTDWLAPLRTLWNRLLVAAGRAPWKDRSADEMTVKELMRTNVRTVPQEATFDEVVAVIEQSRDNTYPVVGAGDELLGVIRYRDLSTALFDPALGSLVRAADITTPVGRAVYPDDAVARACEIFSSTKDDCIPVVTQDQPHQLLGVVRRRDVLRMLIQSQKGSE